MAPDLSTKYLGLELASPFVAAASPLTGTLDSLRELCDQGAAAVVLPSLFEEQIAHDELSVARLFEFGTESFAEARDWFPELEGYNTGPESYLEHLARAKEALSVPVIASLNGASRGGWVRYARRMEEAGADALELNVYVVSLEPDRTGHDVEHRYVDLVDAVRDAVSIPLSVKIGPYFSSLPHLAQALVGAGADGLVLFNRYLQPDIDLETLRMKPSLHLSRPVEIGLSLQWIGVLRDQLDVSLAATSGIHEPDDAIKLLLVGADVCMLASVLFQRGASHVRTLTDALREWMAERDYSSVEQLKGSMSRENSPDPDGFERVNYMRALVSYTGEH